MSTTRWRSRSDTVSGIIHLGAHRQRIRSVIIIGLLVHGAMGCNQKQPEEINHSPPGNVAEVTTSSMPSASEPTLAEGEMSVTLTNGQITLYASQAVRETVLSELAGVSGFGLVRGPLAQGTVTGRLQNISVEAALSFVLKGIPYALRYDTPVTGGAHILVEVMVGT